MYKNFALGVDFYHGHMIDWPIVMPHIDFGIAKCSQGRSFVDKDFPATVEVFKQYQKPLLAFHYYNYYNPAYYPNAREEQLNNLLAAVSGKQIYGIAIDLEEFGNEGADPEKFSDAAHSFCQEVKQRVSFPVLVYTRQSFIDAAAPKINTWIGEFPNWVAQWWWGKDTTVKMNWEEIDTIIPPDRAVVKPLGNSNSWSFWQFSGDRFIFPGIYNDIGLNRTIDLNLFNGTVKDLHAFLKFNPKQEPEDSILYYVLVSGLRIRERPSLKAKIIGRLPSETIVNGYSTIETQEDDGFTYEWAKTDRGWVAVKKQQVKNFMRKL